MTASSTTDRPKADHLRGLARAMIRQARMLKSAGDLDLARELAERARAIDLLSWSYAPQPVPVRVQR